MAGSPRIDELRKKFDENPRRYFAPLANEYRKMGDYEQAIFICQEFLPQQPGHMSGHIVYGQALFEAGRHDESRAVFETALGLDPENLIALRHLGDIALARGDSVAARAWYQRVLDADPRNEEIAGVLHSIDAQGSAPPATPPVPPAAAPAPAPEPAAPAAAPTAPPVALEIQPPASGAQGDELGAVSVVEGLQTSDAASAGTAAAPSPSVDREPEAAAPQPAPAESPATEESGGFDLDALFRRVEGTAPEPSAKPATPQQPAGVDFASAALDLSDASPFPPARASGAFVTETMAELYLQQGHREQALEVYRQLVAARPDDAALRAKLHELEPPPATPVVEASAASGGPTIREFLSALAARRANVGGQGESGNGTQREAQQWPVPPTTEMPQSAPPPPQPPVQEAQSTIGGSLDMLFGGAERGDAGAAGASPLELAFAHDITTARPEAPEAASAELPGRPSKPADTELSLDHVFRKPTPAAGSPATGAGGFSFDQFFSQQAQDNGEASSPEAAREAQPADGDDIQQFNAWLEGLKKS